MRVIVHLLHALRPLEGRFAQVEDVELRFGLVERFVVVDRGLAGTGVNGALVLV
jgi:hypothetical protein